MSAKKSRKTKRSKRSNAETRALGQLLRRGRKQLKLTQERISLEWDGPSASAIHDWERGVSLKQVLYVLKLARNSPMVTAGLLSMIDPDMKSSWIKVPRKNLLSRTRLYITRILGGRIFWPDELTKASERADQVSGLVIMDLFGESPGDEDPSILNEYHRAKRAWAYELGDRKFAEEPAARLAKRAWERLDEWRNATERPDTSKPLHELEEDLQLIEALIKPEQMAAEMEQMATEAEQRIKRNRLERSRRQPNPAFDAVVERIRRFPEEQWIEENMDRLEMWKNGLPERPFKEVIEKLQRIQEEASNESPQ